MSVLVLFLVLVLVLARHLVRRTNRHMMLSIYEGLHGADKWFDTVEAIRRKGRVDGVVVNISGM